MKFRLQGVNLLVKNETRVLKVYILPDQASVPFHGTSKILSIRRTKLNPKGRYVTAEEVMKVGLLYPGVLAKSRDELALLIGRAILDEAGVA